MQCLLFFISGRRTWICCQQRYMACRVVYIVQFITLVWNVAVLFSPSWNCSSVIRLSDNITEVSPYSTAAAMCSTTVMSLQLSFLEIKKENSDRYILRGGMLSICVGELGDKVQFYCFSCVFIVIVKTHYISTATQGDLHYFDLIVLCFLCFYNDYLMKVKNYGYHYLK